MKKVSKSSEEVSKKVRNIKNNDHFRSKEVDQLQKWNKKQANSALDKSFFRPFSRKRTLHIASFLRFPTIEHPLFLN